LALAAAVGAWAVIGHHGDDPRSDPTSEIRERTDAGRPTATRDARIARQAFVLASRRLERAGSYGYRGTVHARSDSDARPAQAPATDVTVEGEVVWPARTHDVAVAASGQAAETITVGPTIWQRQAASEARLDRARFTSAGEVTTWAIFDPVGFHTDGPSGAGAARLPGWLMATTGARLVADDHGRHTYRALLRAKALGETDPHTPPGDGEVTLTVADDGVPTHVEVEAGPAWHLDVDLDAIGDEVTIEPPGRELPAVTGPPPEQVTGAGIAHPVELAELPRGWMLADVTLEGPRHGCSVLELDYGAVDQPKAGGLTLVVPGTGCPSTVGPLTGPGLGARADPQHPATHGTVASGTTDVRYVSSLPADETQRLLRHLVPYDPSVQPMVMEPGTN
jgi:hypothetical protein